MAISPSPCNRLVRPGYSPRGRSSIVRMCARSGRRSGYYGCTGSSGDVWSLFLTWGEYPSGPLHKDCDFRHCLQIIYYTVQYSYYSKVSELYLFKRLSISSIYCLTFTKEL